MSALLVFNALLVLLGLGVARQIIPTRLFAGIVNLLHNTVGITTPTPRQVRMAVAIWITSVLIIVDALALLVAYVF